MSGTGKSTLIASEIIKDLQDGNGVLVVDPTGDLTAAVSLRCPKREVLYIDPTLFPVGFNPLSNVKNKPLAASLLTDVIKDVWDFKDTPTPVLTAVTRCAIATLLEVRGSTLLDVAKLLRDNDYRERILKDIKDPFLLETWAYWEQAYPKKDWRLLISSTENKAQTFGEDPRIADILGSDSAFDLEMMMFDQGAIFLRLPISELGDKTKLLGSLFLAYTQSVAARRGVSPPFSIYVDDCQHFAPATLENLLSVAKRYNLNLTLAHQYLAQLTPELQSALIGNADMRICFKMGIEDSERLHRTMPQDNTKPKLHELGRFEVLTLFEDKIETATTKPLPGGNVRRQRAIVEQSRRRYGGKSVKRERREFWGRI